MLARMGFLTEASGPPIVETPSSGWIFERIEEWNRQFPNRFAFAIDQQETVQEYGYADVLAYANEIATLLEEKGAKPGDRVGILMENIPQWVFVLLGAMRLRAVAVPLATTLPESSVHLIAEHSGCVAIFADETNFEKASNVANETGLYCALLPPNPQSEIRNPKFLPALLQRYRSPYLHLRHYGQSEGRRTHLRQFELRNPRSY